MATVNARLGSSIAGALLALWLGSASSAATPAQPAATANPADPWANAAASAGSADASAKPADPSAGMPASTAAPDAAAAMPAESSAPAAGDAAAASAPSAPAKRLVAVRPDGSGAGTVIHLQADGSLAGFKTFTLRDPARLVIDLPGIQNGLAQNAVSVGTAQVSRVRVAEHDGKLRVVIDAGQNAGDLAKSQVLPTADGLVVAMGEGEGVQQAITAAQAAKPAEGAQAAAAAAAKPAGKSKGGAQVQKVEFTQGSDADHLTVSSDRPVEFHILKPDADTLMVSVPGAHLAADAKTRIAPDAGGPVALVSAFEQPGMKTPEVRVVVKRASGLEPSVHREGNSISLAFERGKGVATLPADEPAAAAMPAAAARDAKLAKAEKGAAAMAPPAAPAGAKGKSKGMGPDGEEPVQMLEEGGLLDGKEYVGRRISLDFKDVDVRDVLRLIADVSDLNIIAGDEVSGNVTIRLVDVPWDQALDVILLTKGLGFLRVGNVLRIAPADTLKQEDEARLQERRAKEKLEDLAVKLQPVNYAKVDQVATLVKRLLTPRGSVDVDKRTNTLVIKDISAVIDEATALVKAIDSQTPQVMIESRIVEANLDFSKQIGVEWGGGSNPNQADKDFTIGGINNQTTPTGNFPYNQSNNVVVTNPMTMTPGGVLNLGSFLLNDKINVDMRLAAAEINGEGKVISSPRVVTLDNAEAMIEQGVSIPFQTFQNGDAQLEFVDAVLSLKVKPHITADKSIIMEIEVQRNAPDTTVNTPTGSPAIAKNQAKTETLVKDGQTLVLGGIYVVNTTQNSKRVPGLWKIPILGAAFRNWADTDDRKELLIFVTPSIVVSPESAS
jgi:type IV pilus assembly protein PilQ